MGKKQRVESPEESLQSEEYGSEMDEDLEEDFSGLEAPEVDTRNILNYESDSSDDDEDMEEDSLDANMEK